MALITSAASGNFNATSTWTGGVIPGVGDTARAATGHTITITANVACDAVTNTATGNGRFVLNDGVTLTANISPVTISTNSQNFVEFNSASPAQCYVVGDVVGFPQNSAFHSIANNSSGTVNVTGNVTGSSVTSGVNTAIANIAGGIVNVTGNVTGTASAAIRNSNVGTIIVTGNVEGGTTREGILNSSTGIIQVVGSFIASSASSAISSPSAFVRASGSFIYAANGRAPVSASGLLLWSTPSNSMTRYALNGLGTFVDMFTADNALGQANPTDVRSGVSYASGSLTGTLAVPVRGTISYGVTYGPAMPFSATRSGTTATATLAYSYPYQVGDTFTVSGAFYSDWNGDYTVASVVSGTSITFSVPATLPASTGAGAVLQTKGTAVLDGASVASAVWSAASRTITGGTVDTLTNAPASVTPSDIWSHATRTLTSASGPTAIEIRQELDSNSTQLSAIKSKTDALPSDPADQSLLEAALAGVTAPSASTVAAAVRSELSVELGRVDQAISSRLASADYTAPTAAPTAAAVATAVRSELNEISNLDASISSRLASAAYTAPANADVAAIKAKTDLLQTDRLAQCSTVATTGAQLAAALS